ASIPSFYRPLGLTISVVLAGLLAWGTLLFAVPAFLELTRTGFGVAPANSSRAGFLVYLRVVSTGVYLVYALGVASDAAAGMTSEHERDTWISLISTPLSGLEIVRGKLLGAVWGIGTTAFVFVLLALAGVLIGSVHPLGFALVLVEIAAFT